MIDETLKLNDFIFSSGLVVNEWLRYVSEKTNWSYQNENINFWGKLYFKCGDISFYYTINRQGNIISTFATGFFDNSIITDYIKYKTTKDVIDICLKIVKKIKEKELEKKKKELNRDFYLDDYDI